MLGEIVYSSMKSRTKLASALLSIHFVGKVCVIQITSSDE